MCGLCGSLAPPGHWSAGPPGPDTGSGTPGSGAPGPGTPGPGTPGPGTPGPGPPTQAPWAAARRRRDIARLADAIAAPARIRVSAWGAGYQVRGPTGRTHLVQGLAELWAMIDRLGGRPDPLDPLTLALLARA